MADITNRHRREFIRNVGLGVVSVVGAASQTRATAANERVRVALIGYGGRGRYLANIFADRQDVELAYIAECNQSRLAEGTQHFPKAQPVREFHDILNNPSVDAIINATPVHWHATGTIAACEAGKHVYVEKPCSHNVREGRLMVEAAQRNQCIVQHGTQVRSTSTIQKGIELLRDGIIGEVVEAKAWNIQRRAPQNRGQQTASPGSLDYAKWLGPVPHLPYHDTFLSGWNWQPEFGTGEIGNDGVHDIDYARWGLGVETHPSYISAAGGSYVYHGGAHFPDTQQVCFEYVLEGKQDKKLLIYEQRLWSTNYPHNCDSGVEFYGTQGQMFLSRRGKLEVLLDRNQRPSLDVPHEPQNTVSHVGNFIDSIINNRTPHADAETAHLTTSLCHLGNITTQLRRTLHFHPTQEQFVDDAEANKLLTRDYRPGHWAVPQGV